MEEKRATFTKHVFSNLTRMLCFVGLEGTGHHYFHAVMANGNKGEWPGPLKMFQFQGTWNQWGMQNANRAWRLSHHSPDKIQPAGWQPKDFKKNGKVLNDTLAAAASRLIVVDPMSTSWPNCIGSHQERSYHCRPNINLMARLAEEVGVDLRIMLMIRPAEEVVAANCMHRDLERDCAAIVRTFILNAEELRQQLLSLDPRFYEDGCSYYGKEHLADTARSLSVMLQGTRFSNVDLIRKELQKSWINMKRNPQDWAKVHEESKPLQSKIFTLDYACRHPSQPEPPKDGASAEKVTKATGAVSSMESTTFEVSLPVSSTKSVDVDDSLPDTDPYARKEAAQVYFLAGLAALNCCCFALCIGFLIHIIRHRGVLAPSKLAQIAPTVVGGVLEDATVKAPACEHASLVRGALEEEGGDALA